MTSYSKRLFLFVSKKQMMWKFWTQSFQFFHLLTVLITVFLIVFTVFSATNLGRKYKCFHMLQTLKLNRKNQKWIDLWFRKKLISSFRKMKCNIISQIWVITFSLVICVTTALLGLVLMNAKLGCITLVCIGSYKVR